MRLVFEELVRSYMEVLQAKLRNFAVGPEFLQSWVHDEDPARSLCGVFEAAAGAGLREPLTVAVSRETLSRLDRAALEAALRALGALRVSDRSGGAEFTVSFAGRATAAPRGGSGPVGPGNPDPRRAARDPRGADRFAGRGCGGTFAELGAPYLAAARSAAEGARREGEAAAAAGERSAAAEEQGIRLSLAVDAGGIVRAARHRGAREAWRGVLETLCAQLEGRPLQEGADHAVLRAEATLRGAAAPRPVAGILLPENADPVFALPQRLLRSAFEHWARATGWKPAWNFWDDGPGPAWAALDAESRLRRARAALASACRELGWPPERVELIAILGELRLVLHAEADPALPPFGPLMLRLERRLKDALDPRLELQLEGLEDRNERIRRTKRDEEGIR